MKWNCHVIQQFYFVRHTLLSDQIRSDQSLSRVQPFATPWIAARQAYTEYQNLFSFLKEFCLSQVFS